MNVFCVENEKEGLLININQPFVPSNQPMNITSEVWGTLAESEYSESLIAGTLSCQVVSHDEENTANMPSITHSGYIRSK